jgi:hypothetical protein
MPLSKTGKEVLSKMVDEYGAKKGTGVFYASINAKKKGSAEWHKQSHLYSKDAIEKAKEMRSK